MIEGILRWFTGWVRVEAEGGYPERLLNEALAESIPLWHLRRQEEQMRFSCPAAVYRRLHPLAHRAGVRMRVRHKHGLPFWQHRYRHRKGLLVGLCAYVLILMLLAPRIWVIQVEGNEITPTEAVLTAAERWGVRLGARMSELDVKGMQLRGPDELTTIAWMTVNPQGCVARIEVTEREPTPEIIDLTTPTDLVAVRDGKILKTEVKNGRLKVKVGEAVTAGTVLITGQGDEELGHKACRAYGQVWAETRRRITVSVPLEDARLIPEGEAVCRPTVSFLCWEFPLYSDTPLQGDFRQKISRYPLKIGGVELPAGVSCEWWQPMVLQPFTRTEEQAAEGAAQRLEQQEQTLFLPNSFEKLSQTGRIKNGQYVLTAIYLCRENIAVEVPIE